MVDGEILFSGPKVYQIEIDGKSYDIRPDYASALARMARLAELDPRSADKARRLRSTFPGVDVSPYCDPRLFLCRALAALGSGQRRIAVHMLTEDPSETSLVTVLHPLTELDPTFLCLLGLHLVTTGEQSKKNAAGFVRESVELGIGGLRRSHVDEVGILEQLREVQSRMRGIVFVPAEVDEPKALLTALPHLVANRFLDVASETGC